MERDPVLRLYTDEVLQQRGELVDAAVKLLVGDLLGLVVLRLGDPDDRVLIAA